MRLIDADALIEEIWKIRGTLQMFDNTQGADKIMHGLWMVEEKIKEAPTIDADRPQGEWIDAEIPLECGGSMPVQVCNLCKTFYPLAYTGGGHRFCPNCGCRMKGADDDTN